MKLHCGFNWLLQNFPHFFCGPKQGFQGSSPLRLKYFLFSSSGFPINLLAAAFLGHSLSCLLSSLTAHSPQRCFLGARPLLSCQAPCALGIHRWRIYVDRFAMENLRHSVDHSLASILFARKFHACGWGASGFQECSLALTEQLRRSCSARMRLSSFQEVMFRFWQKRRKCFLP